jgi:beta-lactamase regulating signal transducer with metallopeptidase domain
MIDFLIKSTICLTIFLGFYHLVLEREKMHQFNRFYLIGSIIISLVIPFVTFEIIEIIPVNQNTGLQIIDTIPLSNETVIQEKINYLPIIFWSLYILISSILIILFGRNIWKLISKANSNPKVKYKNANLILIDEKTLPHTFLNFIYINFEDYNNRNIEDELYTHELVHVNQKHTLDILFIELLKVLFWLNPLYIFYKKAIQLNHEFLADEEIVKTYNNVPFYQNLLLQKSSNVQTIYLASNLNYLVTKKRLIMMTKSTSQTIALLKKIAIIPILIGLIYFFCIEIVAQEKISSGKSEIKKDNSTSKAETFVKQAQDRKVEYLTYKVSDEEYYKDVICVYYENVDGIDMKKWPAENIIFSKKYQELSKNEIGELEILKFLRQEPIVKKSPTQKEINNFKNSKKYAIWIDGVHVDNAKLNNYKLSDFASFSGSVILKNARTKKHPQPFQYWFNTNKYYKDNNMDKWLSRYPGDSLVMTRLKKK